MDTKFRHIRSGLCLTTLAAIAAMWITSDASAQARKPIFGNKRAAAPRPQFVKGEIVLYVQPNTSQADVAAIVAPVNGISVVPLGLPDCYKVVLPAAQATEVNTTTAVAQLRLDQRVRWVGVNSLGYTLDSTTAPTAEPNDPRYKSGEMWGLKLVNMPQAWALQKGGINANVCDIDTCFDPAHEDLIGQYLPESFNFADNISDITPHAGDDQHGVHTSGTMIALTDNGKGIAGICWKNIKCLALRDSPAGTAGLPLASTISCYNFISANTVKLHIKSLNMSYAFTGLDPNGTTEPVYIALKAVADGGVLCCAAAGNEANADAITNTPAGYAFCTTVSAVGRTGKLSSFSSFGKVDLAAPGGDQDATGLDADGILSTIDGKYAFEQGTSMATPHVTAIAGLLMSVPGVDVDKARSVLYATANRSITGQSGDNDPKYGHGLIDAYAALLKVSVSAQVVEPVGIDPSTGKSTDPNNPTPQPVVSLRPRFRFTIFNADLTKTNIVLNTSAGSKPIITNGAIDPSAVNDVTQFTITGSTTPPNVQAEISFRYKLPAGIPFQQGTLTITAPAFDTNIPPATDSRSFSIAPHQFETGISFISIPLVETAQDSPTGRTRGIKEILGIPSAVLYRWVNTTVLNTNGKPVVAGQYAVNGAGAGDTLPANASLQPPDAVTTPEPIDPIDNLSDVRPLGLAFFLKVPSSAFVNSYGREVSQQTVRIPLHEGWNMVGDPYTFVVAFGTTVIETSNGTRYPAAEAANNKLILPFIYRYVGGDYQFQALPAGTMNPWEGNWIYVIPKDVNNLSSGNVLTMLIPAASSGTTKSVPKSISRAANATLRPSVRGIGAWSLRLVAQTHDLTDAHTYIGASSTATDGDDNTKAPKPPKFGSYVSLGVQRLNNATLYAQDLRSLGGSKTWDMVVTTDQANADITVTWPEVRTLPRNVSLTLTDKQTGQTIDLKSQGAFSFNSGPKAETRSISITAAPTSSQGRVVLSNVVINPPRSRSVSGQSPYDINYTVSHDAKVEVTILGTNGRILSRPAPTRAVSAGDNHIAWNGRDNAGHVLAAGIYVVQIRAISADGAVTSVSHALPISR